VRTGDQRVDRDVFGRTLGLCRDDVENRADPPERRVETGTCVGGDSRPVERLVCPGEQRVHGTQCPRGVGSSASAASNSP
jgi:hypothetical protein